MRRLAACLLVLAGGLLALGAGAALAAEADCRPLAGDYAFLGRYDEAGRAGLPGPAPNLIRLLFPGSELADDARIDRCRIVLEPERAYLELRAGAQPLWRIDLAGATPSCRDGALVIEQRRRSLAGSVYEDSLYRHTLRLAASGALVVDTDVSGRYLTWLQTWARPDQHQRASFARFERRVP